MDMCVYMRARKHTHTMYTYHKHRFQAILYPCDGPIPEVHEHTHMQTLMCVFKRTYIRKHTCVYKYISQT